MNVQTSPNKAAGFLIQQVKSWGLKWEGRY